jgi:hypothetical protein
MSQFRENMPKHLINRITDTVAVRIYIMPQIKEKTP